LTKQRNTRSSRLVLISYINLEIVLISLQTPVRLPLFGVWEVKCCCWWWWWWSRRGSGIAYYGAIWKLQDVIVFGSWPLYW